MGQLNIGILGTGNIANTMAATLKKLGGEVRLYAAASRSLEKARDFAKKWQIEKAYGSYEEMAADSEVKLVYIATPHSEHYGNAKLCLEHGRNILVEKAFTANAGQAAEVLAMAKERKLLAAEAIWPRYLPRYRILTDLIKQGAVGEVKELEAEFLAQISHIRRMYDPALCGGALLDLGVYALTAASICLGDDIAAVESSCQLYETGVDAADEIKITYGDGRIAKLRASMIDGDRSEAKITGTKACIRWKSLYNPSEIELCDLAGNLEKRIELPPQISGYEYEILACKEALEQGWTECPDMLHAEILRMMKLMDSLRAQWGIRYPFE